MPMNRLQVQEDKKGRQTDRPPPHTISLGCKPNVTPRHHNLAGG